MSLVILSLKLHVYCSLLQMPNQQNPSPSSQAEYGPKLVHTLFLLLLLPLHTFHVSRTSQTEYILLIEGLQIDDPVPANPSLQLKFVSLNYLHSCHDQFPKTTTQCKRDQSTLGRRHSNMYLAFIHYLLSWQGLEARCIQQTMPTSQTASTNPQKPWRNRKVSFTPQPSNLCRPSSWTTRIQKTNNDLPTKSHGTKPSINIELVELALLAQSINKARISFPSYDLIQLVWGFESHWTSITTWVYPLHH